MRMQNLSCFEQVNWHPDRRELRRFGAAMLVGFALLGIIQAFRTGTLGPSSVALWGAGAMLAGISMIRHAGQIAYLAVYLPASVVGFVVGRFVLLLLFVLLFIPIGLLLRRRNDVLSRKWHKDLKLWRDCGPSPEAARYYRQF